MPKKFFSLIVYQLCSYFCIYRGSEHENKVIEHTVVSYVVCVRQYIVAVNRAVSLFNSKVVEQHLASKINSVISRTFLLIPTIAFLSTYAISASRSP